jgi:putative transposase
VNQTAPTKKDAAHPGTTKDRSGLAHYAFKTAISFTEPTQATMLERAFGTARFAYNWGLATWEEHRKKHLRNTFQSLRNALNAVKDAEFPWMAEVPKDIPAEAIRDLTVAFKNFFDARKGGKSKAKYPARKRKGRSKFSFRLPADRLRFRPAVRADGRQTTEVRLSSLGWVRLAEPFSPGEIVYVTVSRRGDRYFVSFCMQYRPKLEVRKLTKLHSTGIDLGLTHTLTLANGMKIEGPRSLARHQKKLARANRILHRRKLGSRNRTKAARSVGRLHQRIADTRKDFVEKTTTTLLRRHDLIGVESLNVAGMLKARRFSRSLADASFGAITQALERKAKRFGCLVVAVDPFFPSSKICRLCGVKNQDLTLADRVFRCSSPGCGHEEDRDIHAARNIQHQALKLRVPGATGEFTPVESCSLPARPSGLAGKTARRSRKRSPLGVAMSNTSRRQNSDGQAQNA